MEQTISEGYIPPKKGVLPGLAAVCAAICLGFVAVLIASLRAPQAVSAADYPDPVPAALRWQLSASGVSGGMVTVEGWALVEGERFESVDIRPVLWDAAGQAGWALPTYLREDEAARAAAGKVVFGEYGGFTGRCAVRALPAGSYEVCIAYCCNGIRTLVHTGQTLEVGQ